MTDALCFQPAHELARLVRERQVSAAELVDLYLDRIGRYNGDLKAVVTLDADGARARAAEADAALARGDLWGPLHGVPVTIKDCWETAGMRTTCNHPPLSDYIPEHDATVVSRLKAAGVIVMGKTNTPELAADWQTFGPIFPTTSNPSDLSRSPGGSSGGAAAALAAGLCALDIGSDYAGSVRLPANWCGLFGFKPTENRVSTAGHIPDVPGQPRGARHLNVPGPLARSLEDLRLWLGFSEGPDGRDWEITPIREEVPERKPMSGLRIAWVETLPNVPAGRETQAAIQRLAADLTAAGAQVDHILPEGLDVQAVWELGGIFRGERMVSLAATPEELPAALEKARAPFGNNPSMRGFERLGNLDLRVYQRGLDERDQFIGVLDRFLQQYDAWIIPATPTPALPHTKRLAPVMLDGKEYSYFYAGPPYTHFLNILGNPVVTLPYTRSTEGLPIGVQVVGRLWRDQALLQVAETLTEITGPFVPPPAYAGA